jgi:hypothetical protein
VVKANRFFRIPPPLLVELIMVFCRWKARLGRENLQIPHAKKPTKTMFFGSKTLSKCSSPQISAIFLCEWPNMFDSTLGNRYTTGTCGMESRPISDELDNLG